MTPREALKNVALAVREVRATLDEHETLQTSVATLLELVNASEKPIPEDAARTGADKK